jgi:hypothetical protein
MNTILEQIQRHAAALPLSSQAELLNYVLYLKERVRQKILTNSNQLKGESLAQWLLEIPDVDLDEDFRQMSMAQAMRGMEDEPCLYSLDDLEERWQ